MGEPSGYRATQWHEKKSPLVPRPPCWSDIAPWFDPTGFSRAKKKRPKIYTHKIYIWSDFTAFGMLDKPGSEVSKKASNFWFKTGHRCRATAESDRIYEPQLEAPFIPVILLTAIWYIVNALRGFLHVWVEKIDRLCSSKVTKQRLARKSKNDPIVKLKWLNELLGSDGLISLPSIQTGNSQRKITSRQHNRAQ